MNTDLTTQQEARIDALLDGWRNPQLREDFTQTLIRHLPEQEHDETSSKVVPFAAFGPGAIMGAAAALLLLLVVALNFSSREALKSDLVELDSYSDEAVSELYELIHLEGLLGAEDLSPEETDAALLLFATQR